MFIVIVIMCCSVQGTIIVHYKHIAGTSVFNMISNNVRILSGAHFTVT